MHGVIVTNFKRYLDEFIGIEAWKEVVSTAGLQGKTYLPVALYPDEEMEALLRAADSCGNLSPPSAPPQITSIGTVQRAFGSE